MYNATYLFFYIHKNHICTFVGAQKSGRPVQSSATRQGVFLRSCFVWVCCRECCDYSGPATKVCTGVSQSTTTVSDKDQSSEQPGSTGMSNPACVYRFLSVHYHNPTTLSCLIYRWNKWLLEWNLFPLQGPWLGKMLSMPAMVSLPSVLVLVLRELKPTLQFYCCL